MGFKVIQWGLGTTGRLSLDALRQRRELEVVSVRVYAPEKTGRDAGEVCGHDALGVKTSADRAEVIGTAADVVLYMANAEYDPVGCFADVIDLLASGKNVIATGTPFIDPRATDPALGQAVEAACQRGSATFVGLGFFPGYIGETLPIGLSRVLRDVRRLTCRETLLYRDYSSRELMFNVMGFGRAADDPEVTLSDLNQISGLWAGTVSVLTEAFGLKIDNIRPFRETVSAERPFDVAAGHIAAGTVAAIRMGVHVTCTEGAELVVEHCTRMDPSSAPNWPQEEGYEVEVDGAPSLLCRIRLGIHGEEHAEQGCLAAAMHAVHAIPSVVAAPPGIATLATLPWFSGADAFHSRDTHPIDANQGV